MLIGNGIVINVGYM